MALDKENYTKKEVQALMQKTNIAERLRIYKEFKKMSLVYETMDTGSALKRLIEQDSLR